MILNQSVKTIFAELKANPRLRWGLWGIAGVLWLYGVLELRDEIQRQSDAYRAINRKIARIQGTATQTEWLARRQDAQSMQLNLENRLWRESTIGLAQATFHDWLSQLTQQADIAKAQLVVAAQDEESTGGKDAASADNSGTLAAPGLWKVSAKLAFDFNPQSFYPLLTQLTTQEKKVIIESLVIHSTPTPKAELVLVAYFQKPAPGATSELTPRKGQR